MGLPQHVPTGSVACPVLDDEPTVIVGSGPVGVRVLQELRRRSPEHAVVLYGQEPYEPYNRVQLSGLLDGRHKVHDLALAVDVLRRDCPYTDYRQRAVTSIDPEARSVTDAAGVVQQYRKLVLATGSRPFIPAIVGSGLDGVYTFRDMADAERLAARRVQSSHTIVLGAGLLGVEAARGMQRHNTQVTLVDHNPHPMHRQLDSKAGYFVARALRDRRIELLSGSSVRMILGTTRVEGVILKDGTQIMCDTVVLATGIRPNIELARSAGLSHGRGITVDTQMRTSDANIFAVGECCEVSGEVFGLVAPGYEQSAIAVRHILDDSAEDSYSRALLATSLKVAGLSVFSMGEAHPPASMVTISWSSENAYRRLSLVAGRIVGINAVGDWPELPRLRELANKRKWIPPWQLWHFRRSGYLFGEDASADITHWPAEAIVCNCNSVSVGELRGAICGGVNSAQALTARTLAGSGCGSCKPLLQEMLGDTTAPEPVRGSTALASLALPAAVLALLAVLVSLSYPTTVQLDWDWGELWRQEANKQYSGFTILGLCAASVVFSLRKRVAWIRLGDFALWRLGHVVITVLALGALAVHTGFRFGDNLNMWLSACFTALLLAGGLLGVSIAWEHRLSPVRARRFRRWGLWSHVLLSWPLPALLGAHVLKTYYF